FSQARNHFNRQLPSSARFCPKRSCPKMTAPPDHSSPDTAVLVGPLALLRSLYTPPTTTAAIRNSLMPSRFRRFLRWILFSIIGLGLLGAIAVGTLYYLIAPKLPDVETLHDVELQEPMYVYARDGRLMAVFGETRRYPVQIEAVPERLKQAFIAIEDNRFYEHHGVDYIGVGRAVWLLATTDGQRVPGGSTITQQVARQFFLSSEYSYTRK